MRAFLFTVMWLALGSAATAQQQSVIGAVVHTVASDFRHVASVESGVILGGAGGLALGVLPHERDIIRLTTLADGMDDAFNTAQPLGHGLTQVGGAAVLFATGRLAHKPRLDALGRRLMRAQIISGAMTHSVKLAVRRRRPDGGSYSFPSGHTSAAFATATVLQHEFGWKGGAPSYLIASYIGAARAAANKHYVSDLIVGAALGVVSGRAVTALPGTGRKVTVAPVVTGDAAGVMLAWSSRP
jgi:membrane-associated phospholipid phosphatase